jgi:hypothetical protein
MTTDRDICRARSAISHPTDGPITPHVLISRAMNKAAMASSTEALEASIEALYEELYDRGYLREASEALDKAV